MGTYVGLVLIGRLVVGGHVQESLHFSAMSRQLASQISSSATYIQGVAAATGNGAKCDLVIVNAVIPESLGELRIRDRTWRKRGER